MIWDVSLVVTGCLMLQLGFRFCVTLSKGKQNGVLELWMVSFIAEEWQFCD
jgi:hypothetical protein